MQVVLPAPDLPTTQMVTCLIPSGEEEEAEAMMQFANKRDDAKAQDNQKHSEKGQETTGR